VRESFPVIISLWVRLIRCLFCREVAQAAFDLGAKSEESIALRKQVADACEDTIQKFFDGGGQVVIYDANNGVKANRTRLAEKFDKLDVHVVFLGAAIRASHLEIFC
jgi:hypothetical protein